MFKKRDLETLLGIGSVRAPLSNDESPIVDLKEEIEQPPLIIEPESVQETEPKVETSVLEEETLVTSTTDKLIAAYENQIAFLQQQLAVKDEQLGSKDDIIKNFQVLLKLEQDTVLRLTHQIDEAPKQTGWRSWFSKNNPKPAPDEQ